MGILEMADTSKAFDLISHRSSLSIGSRVLDASMIQHLVLLNRGRVLLSIAFQSSGDPAISFCSILGGMCFLEFGSLG